jgi:hypothetical protein
MAEAARIEILMPMLRVSWSRSFLKWLSFQWSISPCHWATPQQVQGVDSRVGSTAFITGKQMVFGQGDGLEAQMP